MKVLVTGAGGFLGRAVAHKAASRGHQVIAMHRPSSPPRHGSLPDGVTPLAGDLRQNGPWTDALQSVDAVIHCAAAASGDLATQLAGTVLATENLISALPKGLQRFVHVSSFSVYDFSAPGPFGRLDEETSLESKPLLRDAYTQTKLFQERLVRDYCRTHSITLSVIRPGAIYGPGKEWDFGRSMQLGGMDLIFAPLSRMRLVHVDDCAAALVDALEAPQSGERIVNVVGDEQPTHWGFHRKARKAGAETGFPVPVPYLAVRGLGVTAWIASRLFFGGKARLPEWLDLRRQQVRWRSLRYGNARAKQEFGWTEDIPLKAGIAGMVERKTD